MNNLANVTITYNDQETYVIEGLTPTQTAQLSAILEASGQWYRWTGNYEGLRGQLIHKPMTFLARVKSWLKGGD
jgi:hypothetical protein